MKYTAEYNDDLDGFVITFANKSVAHTQYYTEQNMLHADFGDRFLDRYSEYDDELSFEQVEQVEEFIQTVNSKQELVGNLIKHGYTAITKS
jgi:hypothetical protein